MSDPQRCPDCGSTLKHHIAKSPCTMNPNPWHTAPAPAPEPPLETCPRCWGHGCYLCNHQGTCEPTAAPTGTGEGSDQAEFEKYTGYDEVEPGEGYGDSQINYGYDCWCAGRAAMRSQLVITQQRLDTTRAEFSYWLIEEDDTQRELAALRSRLNGLDPDIAEPRVKALKGRLEQAERDLATAQARVTMLESILRDLIKDHRVADEAPCHLLSKARTALAEMPSKTGPSRTVEQDAVKSERQYDHSDPWNTMGPWDEQ